MHPHKLLISTSYSCTQSPEIATMHTDVMVLVPHLLCYQRPPPPPAPRPRAPEDPAPPHTYEQSAPPLEACHYHVQQLPCSAVFATMLMSRFWSLTSCATSTATCSTQAQSPRRPHPAIHLRTECPPHKLGITTSYSCASHHYLPAC